MPNDDDKLKSDPMIHSPLPYCVHLKFSLDDDDVPQLRVVDVTAYSVIEAVMQAIVKETGAVPEAGGAKVTVTDVHPNHKAYAEMLVAEIAARRAKQNAGVSV